MLHPSEGEILCFDKPYAMTSFRVVSRVRGILSRRLGTKSLKVGHAGTLDPLATGVLIVCTGKATKLIDALQAGTKEYVATLKLGATTPSFDRETEEDASYPTAHITRALVERTLARFAGRIEQVPPRFSAVKVDGKRAFKLARRGEEVELKPKVLVIDEIELLDCDLTPPPSAGTPEPVDIKRLAPGQAEALQAENARPPRGYPYIRVRIACSKGTYIRALARDIGEALGSGAYLTALRRTRVGDRLVADCRDVDGFERWVDAVGVAQPDTCRGGTHGAPAPPLQRNP